MSVVIDNYRVRSSNSGWQRKGHQTPWPLVLIFVAFPLWHCCFKAASGQFPKQVKCNYPVFTSNVSCPGSNCTVYPFLWTELPIVVFLIFQSWSIKVTETKTRNHAKHHGVKPKTERPADFWNQFVWKPTVFAWGNLDLTGEVTSFITLDGAHDTLCWNGSTKFSASLAGPSFLFLHPLAVPASLPLSGLDHDNEVSHLDFRELANSPNHG